MLNRFITTPDDIEKYEQSNSSDTCVHRYKVEILNLFDPKLQLINTKPRIKNKSNEFLIQFKKFKVQTILVSRKEQKNQVKRQVMIVLNSLLVIQTLMKHLNPCLKHYYKNKNLLL